MNPRYYEDDYEGVVEKAEKHTKKIQKNGATNPARYSARIEHWEDGHEELYYYSPSKERVPHRVAEKLLTPKQIKIMRAKAKKGILTERRRPKGRESIITTARPATKSNLTTR